MSTIYLEATSEVSDLAQRLIVKHFADIQEVETRIAFYFAQSEPSDAESEPKPALKLHGVPVEALATITTYKARVAGHPDVIVYLDLDRWNEATDREKEAVLFRQLYSLVLKRDKEGTPLSDDMGRPKFKKRPADFCITGYYAVAKGFGPEAPEVKAYADLNRWIQSEINFG